MAQSNKKIVKGKNFHGRKANVSFTRNVSSINTPKPSDIQKLIKKVIKKEGE